MKDNVNGKVTPPSMKGRRRLPSRKSGKNSVDCILQATEEILVVQDNVETTTNKIAERAGVNIGTLYQFFENKEAIFVAVYYRTTSKVGRILREANVKQLNEPAEVALPALVETALQVFEETSHILFLLAENTPELRAQKNGTFLANQIYEGSRSYIERHATTLSNDDTEIAYYFMQTTVVEVIRSYLLDRPVQIERERFIKELSRMLINYVNDFLDR